MNAHREQFGSTFFKKERLCKKGKNSDIHGSAPGQRSFKETSQRWRAVGDIVFDLIGPGRRTYDLRYR